VSFVFFLLATIGMTLIIVESYLGDWAKARLFQKRTSEGKWEDRANLPAPLTWLKTLLDCPQCAGMWVGMFVGLLLDPCGDISWLPFRVFFYGTVGSYVAPFGYNLLAFINR
jgi:hypothetical protein